MYWVYEKYGGNLNPIRCLDSFEEATDYANKLQHDWKFQGEDRHFEVMYHSVLVYSN